MYIGDQLNYEDDGQWQVWHERWLIHVCHKWGIKSGYLPTNTPNPTLTGLTI